MTVKVVTVGQMQALEDASERAGVSKDTLMENAGLACAQQVRRHMGGTAGRKTLLLIGPGNNGADGLVIARHLRRWGAEVCCYVVRGRPDHDPKMTDALGYDVDVVDAEQDPGFTRLQRLVVFIVGSGGCDTRRRAVPAPGRRGGRSSRAGEPPPVFRFRLFRHQH